jgi:hypothetical protein
MDPGELVFQQMLDFDITDLRRRLDLIAPEQGNAAPGIAEQLEDIEERLQGDIMNDDERAIVFPDANAQANAEGIAEVHGDGGNAALDGGVHEVVEDYLLHEEGQGIPVDPRRGEFFH